MHNKGKSNRLNGHPLIKMKRTHKFFVSVVSSVNRAQGKRTPNKGHFGANSFVPCREVVPISEVK